MDVFAAIISFDEHLYGCINGQWTNLFLDTILPICRDKYTWIPLYIGILVWIFWKGLAPGKWWLILGLITCVASTDAINSHLLKKSFQRPRPCKSLDLPSEPRMLIHCSSGYSFPSSHAANHFGLATFLVLTIGSRWRKTRAWWWFWAASIAYAQVYVGVHYPLDVMAGAMVGGLIGWLIFRLFEKKLVHIWAPQV